uniref:Disease resistance R13L4/SHOC-2-like LRR domain-containing protein n=1 Tax=Corethron hystrix TaxID=216773 RepID=A0A6U5H7D0_9STRA|mmetsp:Transcript_2942/g.5524  ORF Transcript_2942/g.5524 Transcript_2942/m.5524 type:complete len:454 (+) Transcript_2942:112-1473(+)
MKSSACTFCPKNTKMTSNYFLRSVAASILIFVTIIPTALGLLQGMIKDGAECLETKDLFDGFNGADGVQTPGLKCTDLAPHECGKIISRCHADAKDCIIGAGVNELCPISCGYLPASESRSDLCNDGRSRKILKCLLDKKIETCAGSVSCKTYTWRPTAYCVDMICNKPKEQYETSVKDAIATMENGKTIHIEAQNLIIKNRICPTSVSFNETYAMYSLAFSLFIYGVALDQPEECGGYENRNPCLWSGVYCYRNSVAELVIEQPGKPVTCTNCQKTGCRLTGTLPTQIEYLKNIKRLNLGGNSIRGSIPSEIGRLKMLERLDLDRNEMTGIIPRELFDLTQLKWLDLDTNCFIGKISNAIHKLKHLELLSLHDNRFLGEIPTALTQLRKLSVLYLDCNVLLNGHCTESFCRNNSNLKIFWLDCSKVENCQNCATKCVPASRCVKKICRPPPH